MSKSLKMSLKEGTESVMAFDSGNIKRLINE